MHYSSKYLFFTTRTFTQEDGYWPEWYGAKRVLTWHTPWFYLRVGSWQ